MFPSLHSSHSSQIHSGVKGFFVLPPPPPASCPYSSPYSSSHSAIPMPNASTAHELHWLSESHVRTLQKYTSAISREALMPDAALVFSIKNEPNSLSVLNWNSSFVVSPSA